MLRRLTSVGVVSLVMTCVAFVAHAQTPQAPPANAAPPATSPVPTAKKVVTTPPATSSAPAVGAPVPVRPALPAPPAAPPNSVEKARQGVVVQGTSTG